jgi:hypothetical protein
MAFLAVLAGHPKLPAIDRYADLRHSLGRFPLGHSLGRFVKLTLLRTASRRPVGAG